MSYYNDCIPLVATVGEGFSQSNNCQYYFGTVPNINVGSNDVGVVMLYNPASSNSIVYLNKLTCSNYSNSPIQVEVYAEGKVGKNIIESKCKDSGNTKCHDCSNLKLLYGNVDMDICGTKVYTRSIPSFESSDGYPNGSIILYPGSTRLYVIKPIIDTETSISNLSFAWWESIDKYK